MAYPAPWAETRRARTGGVKVIVVHKYSSTGTSPAVGTTNQRGSLRTCQECLCYSISTIFCRCAAPKRLNMVHKKLDMMQQQAFHPGSISLNDSLPARFTFLQHLSNFRSGPQQVSKPASQQPLLSSDVSTNRPQAG